MLWIPLVVAAAFFGCSQEAMEPTFEPDGGPELYAIETPEGTITIRLYHDTPLHRDNFRALVAEQFYDSLRFHRVIEGFMIQGGDPNSRDDDLTDDGQGGPGYTIPAEIRQGHYHKRGVLAAARTGDRVNPERASSGSQFYLMQGRVWTDAELDQVEQQLRRMIPDSDFRFSDEAREAYTTVGGYPTLDQMYTIFGEIVDGFDVLDRIAATPTYGTTGQPVSPTLRDQPVEPMWMVIREADEPSDT